MIKKIVFTASILVLPIYLLFWLAIYFLGSSTQCGDGFASAWPLLVITESALFIAMYYGAEKVTSSKFQKQFILISNFIFLAAYVYLFVWIAVLGYQHCGAGEFHKNYAHGLIRLWPALFIIVHVILLFMFYKKLTSHSKTTLKSSAL